MKPLSKEEFKQAVRASMALPHHERNEEYVLDKAATLYAKQLDRLIVAQPCTHPNLWPNGSGQLRCECGREMHAHKADANGYCEVCGDPAPQGATKEQLQSILKEASEQAGKLPPWRRSAEVQEEIRKMGHEKPTDHVDCCYNCSTENHCACECKVCSCCGKRPTPEQPKGSKAEEFRKELDAQVASSLPGLTSDLACTLFEKFMGEQEAAWQASMDGTLGRMADLRSQLAAHKLDDACFAEIEKDGAKMLELLQEERMLRAADRNEQGAQIDALRLQLTTALEERDRAKEALARTQATLFKREVETEKLQAERDSLRGELEKLQAERESLISTERDRIWRRVQKAKDDLGQFQQFLIWLAQPSRDKLAAVIRRYRLRDRQWRQKWMAQVDAHVATGQKETALQAEVSRLTEELQGHKDAIFNLQVAFGKEAMKVDALSSQLSLAKGLAEAVQNIYGRNPDVARMATTLNIALVRALTAFLEATKEGAGE